MTAKKSPASPEKPIFDNDYKKAYEEGHRLGLGDALIARNPHKEGTSAWFGWADGEYDGRSTRKRQFAASSWM